MISGVPNSCTRPTRVLNGCPASATSSPMRNTRGSRRISSAMASRTASPYVSSRSPMTASRAPRLRQRAPGVKTPIIPGMLKTLALALLALTIAAPRAHGADIDRTAVDFKTPADITWVRNAAGTNEQAVLFGDPSKPGPYVVRIKWFPGNMSRPHFHPNDRFFVVVSGTWWMGTGETFDPERTVPAPAGSYVIHYGGKVHYDGAKTEETIIQVWGMGPATSTPAGKKQ